MQLPPPRRKVDLKKKEAELAKLSKDTPTQCHEHKAVADIKASYELGSSHERIGNSRVTRKPESEKPSAKK